MSHLKKHDRADGETRAGGLPNGHGTASENIKTGKGNAYEIQMSLHPTQRPNKTKYKWKRMNRVRARDVRKRKKNMVIEEMKNQIVRLIMTNEQLTRQSQLQHAEIHMLRSTRGCVPHYSVSIPCEQHEYIHSVHQQELTTRFVFNSSPSSVSPITTCDLTSLHATSSTLDYHEYKYDISGGYAIKRP